MLKNNITVSLTKNNMWLHDRLMQQQVQGLIYFKAFSALAWTIVELQRMLNVFIQIIIKRKMFIVQKTLCVFTFCVFRLHAFFLSFFAIFIYSVYDLYLGPAC